MYSNLENELSELHDEICILSDVAFSQCTLCAQCAGSCPKGIDLLFVMRSIRAVASTAGVAPGDVASPADGSS